MQAAHPTSPPLRFLLQAAQVVSMGTPISRTACCRPCPSVLQLVHARCIPPTVLPLPLLLQATTMVFRAAMRRLLQEDALRGLRADLRQFNRGAVMSEAELAYLLGALSASPELGLDPAEVQQYVKAAFEEAQQEAAHLPSSFACSAASAAADPFSSKVPLQPLQRVDSGTASSSSAAFDFDRMAAQGGPCDFGGAFQEQASSWANTAWPDSAGVEDPAGSHYSSSSSAAELPGSPFQQLSPSASLCGLAPAAGDEELPEVRLHRLRWGLPVLGG